MTRTLTSRWPTGLCGLLLGAALGGTLLSPPVEAALPNPQISGTATTYENDPLTGVTNATPIVMLAMSRDHQLHLKAYTDYSNLDSDPALEITYDHAVNYYGYFDPAKCYDYDATDQRFEPQALAPADASVPATFKYCDTVAGAWSGNFLNWVSMTRMDAIRKLLYGGYRSTDSTALAEVSGVATTPTVLERAFLPHDAHSFAKHYNGSDIDKLTPFAPPTGDATHTVSYSAASPGSVFSGGVATSLTSGASGCTQPCIFRQTATLARVNDNSHGLVVNQVVRMTGNGVGGYNGFKQITAVTANTYDFAIANGTAVPTGNSTVETVFGSFTPTAAAPLLVGDQIEVTGAAGTNQFIRGSVGTIYTGGSATNPGSSVNTTTSGPVYIVILPRVTNGATAQTSWTLANRTSGGLSFCNTTVGASSGANQRSATNTNPPLLRVATGNYELWATNERWQCRWYDENNATNNNAWFESSLDAGARNPDQDTHSLGTGNTGGASAAGGNFIVRVATCVSNALVGSENCKTYPDGMRQPIGLLQLYGDEDRIRFGLMTGSNQRNISGGVLRKNAGSFGNEINETTNGTFVSLTTGVVNTLNKLRPVGYNYADGAYVDATNGDDCNFLQTGLAMGPTLADRAPGQACGNAFGCERPQGKCRAWGNPMSEIYLESLRYLAGNGITADTRFTTDNPASTGGAVSSTADGITGLGYETTWTDPLTSGSYCAPLNVLLFNASTASYDDDQLSTASTLTGSTAAALTNAVGTGEGISGSYFVGGNSGGSDDMCSAKTLANLSEVRGICPEAPSAKGTYFMAGLAHWAHTNRIRDPATSFSPAVTIPPDDTTSLEVDTYAIQLATNTPKIQIPGTSVTIIPAYRMTGDGGTVFNNKGAGALVDFRVVQAPTATSGKFLVNWEDSEQGGDFDQDMWGFISYAVSGSTVTVTTEVVFDSTPAVQGFGYIISGVTKDGPHFHSGSDNFSFTDPDNVPIQCGNPPAACGAGIVLAGGGCDTCQTGDAPTTATYTIGGSPASLLNDPLWYAAKWGGFNDATDDVSPATPPVPDNEPGDVPDGANNATGTADDEWDAKTSTGAAGDDNVPDNYFLVTNPIGLEEALRAAFDAILAKTASGTAAAVVANAREGEGAVYQALFEPKKIDDQGRKAQWIGTLHALFVDEKGDLREDGTAGTPGDGVLGSYDADPAVEIFFDTGDRTTKLRRYPGDPALGGGVVVSNVPATPGLSDLHPIWNARERLSALSNVLVNRTYTSAADTGRYIFTFLDLNRNGVADSGEQVDFDGANFGSGRFGILNVQSATAADNLIDYIRGQEASGYRTRTVDYDGDGDTEVMRLGDIVNSTPTVVGTPAEGFDLLYDDSTYSKFRAKYRQRRNVVYVGSNDGFIHAFNAGFYDASASQFRTTPNTGSATAHPLGTELWSYVPFNLLPHLTWLSDPLYKHMWYVDGKPRVFDARIYPSKTCADTTHPCGWATLLVVGFRMGGKDLTLSPTVVAGTTDFSAFSAPAVVDATSSTHITTRSAYVVMDVTNPEAAPVLLAEVTDPNLGLATSFPTGISISEKGNRPCTASPGGTPCKADGTTALASTDKWFLTFGNGPTVYAPADPAVNTSTSSNGRLFVYDLVGKAFGTNYDLGNNATTGAPTSFLADPVTVDWDLDFKADNVYVGTVGGTVNAPLGKLFKLGVNEFASQGSWTAPVVFVNPASPIVSTPAPTFDKQGRKWVISGTGRFFTASDKSSSAQHHLFGAIDNPTDFALPRLLTSGAGSLYNVSAAVVETDGDVTGITGVTTITALENQVMLPSNAHGGWYLNLTNPTTPSERNVNQIAVLGGALFATAFTPDPSQCGNEGSSRLLGLCFQTGTGCPAVTPFGFDPGTLVIDTDVFIGKGLAASPSLHQIGDGGDVSVITQTSTGAIEIRAAEVLESSRSGEVDWEETEQ